MQIDLFRTAVVPGHNVFRVVIRIDDRALNRIIVAKGGKRSARAFFHSVQFSALIDSLSNSQVAQSGGLTDRE